MPRFLRRRFKGYLLAALLGTLLACVLFLVAMMDYYLPMRPTTDEARQDALTSMARREPFYIDHLTVYLLDPQVLLIAPTEHYQMVFISYLQMVAPGQLQRPVKMLAATHQFEVRFFARHLVSGVNGEWGSGGGYGGLEFDEYKLQPLAMTYGVKDGVYFAAGMASDPAIRAVRIHWQDGVDMVSTPSPAGAFWQMRPVGHKALTAVGLDVQGQVLTTTETWIDHDFAPNFIVAQSFPVPGGVVVAQAYTQSNVYTTTPIAENCVGLTYATAETAAQYLSPSGALTGQRTCTAAPNGPTVLTTMAGGAVLGGYVPNRAAVVVLVEWADGVEETLPLQAGLYLTHRPNAAPNVNRIVPKDATGHPLGPAP